ncbi:MAG: DUF2905 domain-containing protein [Pseudomonadota bacterium]
MQRILITAGIALVLAGIAWPWLGRIPFGRLPGDIVISRPGFTFFFPITTMIVISILVSIIIKLFK